MWRGSSTLGPDRMAIGAAAELKEAVIEAKTAVACLGWLSAKYRTNATPGAADLARHLGEGCQISVTELISITSEFGFQGRYFCRDWYWLKREAADVPVLLVLKNRNTVVAVAGGGGEEIRLSDPLYRDGEILTLPRKDFECAWEGEAVTIAPQLVEGGTGDQFSATDDPLGLMEPPSNAAAKRRSIAISLSLCPVALVSVIFMVTVGRKTEPTVNAAHASSSATQIYEHPSQATEATAQAPTRHPATQLASAAPAAIPSDNAIGRPETAAAETGPQAAAQQDALYTVTPAVAIAALPDAASPATTTAAVEPASPPLPTPESDTAGRTAIAPAAASSADVTELLKRGDDCLRIADISFARLFYQRAADAGAPDAALKLAETFDPLFLERANLSGITGNIDQAMYWYRRARYLGSSEADILLENR